MALTHIPSLNSEIDIHLGNVPPNIEDPVVLYQELLDIHSAIESLLTGVADYDEGSLAYIAKQRSVSVTGDLTYNILITDGLILLSGFTNTCTAVLPEAASVEGHRYSIKCVDDTNDVYVATSGGETVDGDAANFQLWKDEIIEVQSDGTEWWIR